MSSDTVIKKDNDSEPSTWWLILLFGLFALVGTFIFWMMTARPAYLYMSSQSWVETPCKILVSRVESQTLKNSGGKSTNTTHSVDIRYAYDIDGQEYEGTCYDLMGIGSPGHKKKLSIVESHPVGSMKKCYVNPRNPEASFISRSVSLTMVSSLIFSLPIMFIGYAGLAWVCWIIFRRVRKKPEANRYDAQA